MDIARIAAPEQKVHRDKLGNGLTLIHVERPELPDVAIAYVNDRAGTLSTEYDAALVHATALSLRHGGTRFRDQGVLSDLNVNGEYVEGGANEESTVFELQGLEPAFEDMVEVMAQTVRAPAFVEGAIGAAQSSPHRRSEESMTPADAFAWIAAVRSVLPGASGDELLLANAARRRFPREMVERCYEDLYRPDTSAIVVVGAVPFERALRAVHERFDSWLPNTAPTTDRHKRVVPTLGPRGVRVHLVDTGRTKALAGVFLVQAAPGWNSVDADPMLLGSEVLGGSYDSRMNHSLRHQSGATYGVRVTLDTYREFGLLFVNAELEASETAGAIREVLAQLGRLQREALNDQELALVKLRAAVRYRQRTRNDALFAFQLSERFVRQDHDDDPELAAIELTTAEDIRRAAAAYLHPNNVDVFVTGDATVLSGMLQGIGTLDVLRR